MTEKTRIFIKLDAVDKAIETLTLAFPVGERAGAVTALFELRGVLERRLDELDMIEPPRNPEV